MNETIKQVCDIQGLSYPKIRRIYSESTDVQRKILNLGFERIIRENQLKQAI